MLRIQRGLPKIALGIFELHSHLSRSNPMILSPTERLHSQFQHPKDHGHTERLEKQFPNFALFTMLLRHVRLSQSVGCQTKTIIALVALRRQSHSLFERWSKSFGDWTPQRPGFHPDAHPKRIERGTSRRVVKNPRLFRAGSVKPNYYCQRPTANLSTDIAGAPWRY
jgi:hypothetical protein